MATEDGFVITIDELNVGDLDINFEVVNNFAILLCFIVEFCPVAI